MWASASILGKQLLKTGQEMNVLLAERGYLEGVPGSYSVTEKGKPYSRETDEFRGNPRSLSYSTQWSTRSWDDAILPDLQRDRTEGDVDATDLAAADVGSTTVHGTTDSDAAAESGVGHEAAEDASKPLWIKVVVLAVPVVVGVACHPRVRNWAREDAVPKAKTLWRKVTRSDAAGDAHPHDIPHLSTAREDGPSQAAEEAITPEDPPQAG